MPTPNKTSSTRTITLEEHFVTKSFLRATGADQRPNPTLACRTSTKAASTWALAALPPWTKLLSTSRSSHWPPSDSTPLKASSATSLATDVNDELSAAVQANPTRLAAFTTLALKDPAAAAKELDRSIGKLNFRGVLLDGTTDGLFPRRPSLHARFRGRRRPQRSGLSSPRPHRPNRSSTPTSPVSREESARCSQSPAGGGMPKPALHTLRLITSGVFDRFPTLQLIIGHMGRNAPHGPRPHLAGSLPRRQTPPARSRLLPIEHPPHHQRILHPATLALRPLT